MCGGMQRCTDRCTEGLVKVYKGTQNAQRYAGCTEECAEVHGGTQGVHKGWQRYTVVF